MSTPGQVPTNETTTGQAAEAALAGPHPELVLAEESEGSGGRTLALDRALVLAGSGARCRLVLENATVSKVHAAFVRDGSAVCVRDLASREGTRVGGERTSEQLLAEGDRIEIGGVGIVYHGTGGAGAGARAPDGSVNGVAVEGRTLVIGRREGCEVRVDDERVSSAHALVFETGGRRFVRDLGSRTGVRVNGEAVQLAGLRNGDVIGVGDATLKYEEAPAKVFPVSISDEAIGGSGQVISQPQASSEAPSTPMMTMSPGMGSMGSGGNVDDFDALMASLEVSTGPAGAGQAPARADGGKVASTPAGGAYVVTMSTMSNESSATPGITAVVVDLAAAQRGAAEVRAENAVAVDPSAAGGTTTPTTVGMDDLGGLVATAHAAGAEAGTTGGMEGATGAGSGVDTTGSRGGPVMAARAADRDAADLGRMLRPGMGIPEPLDELPTYRGPIAGRIAVWVVMLSASCGAAYGAWMWAAPGTVVRATLSVAGVNDPVPLMTAVGVRELAIGKLKETDPSVPPGELASDASVRAWAAGARGERGSLVVEIAGGRVEAARLKALLLATAERASPVRVTPAAQIAQLKETARNSADALKSAQTTLADLEARAKESPRLAALTLEAGQAQKRRDDLASKLEAAKAAAPPAVDEGARAKLDAAVASFGQQLEAAKAQQGGDARLAAFVAAAQNVQEEGARLTDLILTRRQEEAERLLQLKRRLDERMRVRQQQAWDSDEELKRLGSQIEDSRRRLEATAPSDTARQQDLRGEIDYLDGLIKSRRLLVGSDRGDQRALTEVQSIIDEQAKATEQDRRKLLESFEQMRGTLARAVPDAGTVPDTQRKLATDLEARLGELQQARAALAEASSTALARHEESLRKLETDVAAADKEVIEKQASAEQVRATLPNTRQLDEARARVERLKVEAADTAKAVEAAEVMPKAAEMAVPQVSFGVAASPQRPWLAGGAGVLTALLLASVWRLRS